MRGSFKNVVEDMIIRLEKIEGFEIACKKLNEVKQRISEFDRNTFSESNREREFIELELCLKSFPLRSNFISKILNDMKDNPWLG